jgi:hypothetical protein
MSRHPIGPNPYGIATTRLQVTKVPPADSGTAGTVQTSTSVSPVAPIATAVRTPISGTIGITHTANGAPLRVATPNALTR